jgi:hypothetical protein
MQMKCNSWARRQILWPTVMEWWMNYWLRDSQVWIVWWIRGRECGGWIGRCWILGIRLGWVIRQWGWWEEGCHGCVYGVWEDDYYIVGDLLFVLLALAEIKYWKVVGIIVIICYAFKESGSDIKSNFARFNRNKITSSQLRYISIQTLFASVDGCPTTCMVCCMH